jgi:hypothetical protein
MGVLARHNRRQHQCAVQDRSPDDSAAAFAAGGFEVSARRFGYNGFVPASKDRRYYPKLLDALDYPAEHKLLFRCVKRGRDR